MSRFGIGVAVLSAVLLAGLYGVLSASDDEGDPIAGPTTLPTTPVTSTTVTSTTSTAPPTGSTVTEPPATTTTAAIPETTTTSKPPSTTSTTVPPFSAAMTVVDADFLSASWRAGCPVAVEDLRLLTMSHWGYDAKPRLGRLVVAANVADDVISIFADLYDLRFPIERMEPVEAYGGDDNASMAANNTSAFNCRQVTGGSSFSEHSYGRAIDVNPLVNPYVNGSTVLPTEGRPYVDRSVGAPGMILAGDGVTSAFGSRGWIWGGTWTSLKDYQHFSTTGR